MRTVIRGIFQGVDENDKLIPYEYNNGMVISFKLTRNTVDILGFTCLETLVAIGRTVTGLSNGLSVPHFNKAVIDYLKRNSVCTMHLVFSSENYKPNKKEAIAYLSDNNIDVKIIKERDPVRLLYNPKESFTLRTCYKVVFSKSFDKYNFNEWKHIRNALIIFRGMTAGSSEEDVDIIMENYLI